MTTSQIFTNLSVVISITLGILAIFTEWFKGNEKMIVVTVLLLYVVIFGVFKSPYFVIYDFVALVPTHFSKRIFRNIEPAFLSRVNDLRGYATIEFARDFSDYCARCSKMVEETNGNILTVQTPHFVRGDYEQEFNQYIKCTVKKILERSDKPVVRLYRRLIVVDQVTVHQEKHKLSRFLEELFSSANDIKPPPSLDSVELCIVHRIFAASLFYSNVDVHITSDSDCAVAFQVLDDAVLMSPAYEWKASLHVMKPQFQAVYPTIGALKTAYDALWKKGRTDGAEFSFKSAYQHAESDLGAEQLSLRQEILRKMDEIANSYMDLRPFAKS